LRFWNAFISGNAIPLSGFGRVLLYALALGVKESYVISREGQTLFRQGPPLLKGSSEVAFCKGLLAGFEIGAR